MKKIWTGAALAALFAFPAFAQDPAPSRMKNEPPAPQEQRTKVESKGDAMTAGQISASELLDETVMSEANESIGDVNDVLIDTNGKIASVIVGVGGFPEPPQEHWTMPTGTFSVARSRSPK